MKKRLLITSVVMMLVVAVALSTATYAWFTSNASVTANSISVTAATNSSASIGISWTNSNYGTTLVGATTGELGAMKPTAIANNATNTVYANNLWTSATMHQTNSKNYFNAVTTGADNLCYTFGNGEATEFYINNGSTANTITSVTMTATVAKPAEASADASKFIRIAVFKYNTTSENYELKAILGGVDSLVAVTGTAEDGVAYYNADGVLLVAGTAEDIAASTAQYTVGQTLPANTYVAGKVAVGTAVANSKPVTINDTATGTGTWGTDFCIKDESIVYKVDLGGLAVTNGTPTVGSDVMQLKVVIWMDGTALNDDSAGEGKVSSIGFTFDAVQ